MSKNLIQNVDLTYPCFLLHTMVTVFMKNILYLLKQKLHSRQFTGTDCKLAG